ncbi:unnamed protein product [Caenorhabditis auriculariae]|uniref:Uncharacterized protein n=1 Tax=Caenorhabditis auriculariae TaxID=2777116 RepID=A0A8S1H9S4_9PELO|nr:unnamed protein product [Caenorhabditis auriculariae]
MSVPPRWCHWIFPLSYFICYYTTSNAPVLRPAVKLLYDIGGSLYRRMAIQSRSNRMSQERNINRHGRHWMTVARDRDAWRTCGSR